MSDIFRTWLCQCGEAMVSGETAEEVTCQFCGTTQPLTVPAAERLGHRKRIPNKLSIHDTVKPTGEHWRIRFAGCPRTDGMKIATVENSTR